ncbi:non-canonical purine NTP diphosphatase [Salinimicrobium sp. GXAS 041]|uniref:non-canonical purine NTP diphosphatase n=1 Tax=Salinimicrobium sp. GXAS 041 TaxID=3400806 RepID=UPI003C773846
MELVFATQNRNKMEEIQALMPSNVKLLCLKDINCTEDIPETAETIDGNAILKAEYVKNKLGYDCFADDTGLMVDALDGEPGVYSARYAGEHKNDIANMEKLLTNMEGKKNRKARFKTVIALNLNEHEILFTGICTGTITTQPRGDQGFGYDPVFQPDGSNKTFAEMTLLEKSQLSHRSKAVRELIDYLAH